MGKTSSEDGDHSEDRIIEQLAPSTIMALLPYPISKENSTGRMKYRRIRRRKGGSIGLCLQILLSLRKPVPSLDQRLVAFGQGRLHLAQQAALKAIINTLQWAHLSALSNSWPGLRKDGMIRLQMIKAQRK